MRLTVKRNVDTSPLSIPFGTLKCHSNVRHLQLVGASEENLQDVFEHMTDLESLALKVRRGNDVYAFTGQDTSRGDRGYSIKRLQKLEYLNLNLILFYGDLAKIIQELQLPRLKHFILYASEECFYDGPNLRRIFLNMPALESSKIFIHVRHQYFENIIESCELAKNLIYLCIDVEDASLQTESSVAPLFKACPSLRFLHFRASKVLFSFNPFTKKISMICSISEAEFIFPRNAFLHQDYY